MNADYGRRRWASISGRIVSPVWHRSGGNQTPPTSTTVSLKQAPAARSARRSAETRAEIVRPLRLVASQAPFSLATTPGGTALLTSSGRITSPRPFHTLTSAPELRPRAAASFGFISRGGARREPGRWPRVEEMRLSEEGEISLSG